MFPNIAHSIAAPLPFLLGQSHGQSHSHSHFHPFRFGHNRRHPLEAEQPRTPAVVEPTYYVESDDVQGFLYVELPGVRKRDIVIELHGHHLSISAKRYAAALMNLNEEKEPKLLVQYDLQLGLSHDTDVAKVKVEEYTHGVLAVNIPVVRKKNGRKIKIDV
ncbi:heat-shock protein Hsp20 [Gracilaria domingensis]|nr:heat-shock protein Hsp20 [Gracilaria domingensis]